MSLRALFGRKKSSKAVVDKNRIIEDLVSGDTKCQEIIARVEATYGVYMRPMDLTNLSAYFFIDMLEKAFAKAKVFLPPEINVLDVGTAGWYYAPALLPFLQSWQGPRTVNLGGIDFPKKDYQEAIGKLQEKWNLKMHWGDVMDFSSASQYDIILINHMLTGPNHCRRWKIPYRPFSSLFPHIQSLGKPNSLVVITAHTYAGESAFINCFDEKSKLTEFFYDPEVEDNFSSFLSGYFGFHDNAICICRSPYVNLEKCQKYDKNAERWDEMLRKL